jgi:hypothetical protein
MKAAASCLVPPRHPSSCQLFFRYRGLSDAIIIQHETEMIGTQADLVNTQRRNKEMYR